MRFCFQSLAAVTALFVVAGAHAAEPNPARPDGGASVVCVDGEKPTEPFSQHDKWGMQRYDAELLRYKRDHENYLRCRDRRQGGPSGVEQKLQDAMQAPEQR